MRYGETGNAPADAVGLRNGFRGPGEVRRRRTSWVMVVTPPTYAASRSAELMHRAERAEAGVATITMDVAGQGGPGGSRSGGEGAVGPMGRKP